MDAPLAAGEPGDFVSKWRGAWPEWALVEGFVPAAQRELAVAWNALQFEWQEATWRGDARPGDLKLQWWMEELDGWAQGRRRHPLGSVLQRQPAPWRAIAAALPSLAGVRTRPDDTAQAWSALQQVAEAVAQADVELLGGAADARAVAATWLHARLARHPDDAVPQALMSGADPAVARRDWSASLLADWPKTRGLSAPRGISLALARARLARGDAASPLPPWSAVWAGWRGARG